MGSDSGFRGERFGLSWGSDSGCRGERFGGAIRAFVGSDSGFRGLSWGAIRAFRGERFGLSWGAIRVFVGSDSGFRGERFGLSSIRVLVGSDVLPTVSKAQIADYRRLLPKRVIVDQSPPNSTQKNCEHKYHKILFRSLA